MERISPGCRSATHPNTKKVALAPASEKRSNNRLVVRSTRLSYSGQSFAVWIPSKADTWKYSSTSMVSAFMGMIIAVRLAGPGLEENGADRFERDQPIQTHGHVLDVIEIVLQLFGSVLNGCAIAEFHLRPAGYAGFHREPIGVIRHLPR